MTLKKRDGKLSLGKISLLAGILASFAVVVQAMPTAIDYCRKGASPWTTLPAEVRMIAEDVKDIKQALGIVKTYQRTFDSRTNSVKIAAQ